SGHTELHTLSLHDALPILTDTSACMDWPAIQMRRRAQLRRLFEAFRHKRPERLLRDFEAFCRQGGDALHGHACYEALHAHHVPEDRKSTRLNSSHVKISYA